MAFSKFNKGGKIVAQVSVSMLLGLSFIACASASTKYNAVNGSGDTYKPLYQLTACYPSGAPAGYLWTSGHYDSSCYGVGQSGELMVFSSYFDKSVGSQMTICDATRPAGWALVSTSLDTARICGSAGVGGVGQPTYRTRYTIRRIQ